MGDYSSYMFRGVRGNVEADIDDGALNMMPHAGARNKDFGVDWKEPEIRLVLYGDWEDLGMGHGMSCYQRNLGNVRFRATKENIDALRAFIEGLAK